MSKLKIAIYSGVIPSTTFIENLIKAIAHEGMDVQLYGYSNIKTSYLNLRIRCFTYPNNKISLTVFAIYYAVILRIKSPADFRKIKKFIQSKQVNSGHGLILYAKYLPIILHRPDIFHIQWAKGCEEWMFLKDMFGIKIVLSLRGTHINITPVVNTTISDIYKSIFKDIDGFHAVSKEIFHLATKYGADPAKIKVVYSGIDFEKISPYKKSNYSIPASAKIISIGRVHWSKGYQYALDSLKILSEKGYDFQYTIITDYLSEEILYQIQDCGLVDRVKVFQSMPQFEIFKAMQQADLFLLASVEEGIANVVLEAMALGLPVVSSNCGGMAEVIEHGKNGYLFKNRDSEDMASKIITVLALNDEKRLSIALAAKQKAEELYNLKQLGVNMLKLYDNVLCA